jgi:hypothetical protein
MGDDKLGGLLQKHVDMTKHGTGAGVQLYKLGPLTSHGMISTV